jgi:hypothetical protein
MTGGGAPARSQELIFLDPDDDLGTVRAKLESSPADDVFLVVPRRAATLRTPLEYRILARLAHELSTDVTVVSADAGRRQLAQQEGLRTRRGYTGVRHLAEAAGAPNDRLPRIPEWVPIPSATSLVVLAVLLALGAVLAFGALPVMQVTITPASETFQRELELIVDPAARTADPATGVLPGETLQDRFDLAGSVPATGQKAVGRDQARGEVVFSNGSANAVTLPARTVLVARNGARFLTDAELQVNPYSFGTARVGVTAEQRGIAGNLDVNQVATTDPPIQGLTVTNQRPIAGGADRPAAAVAEADRAKLKEQLTQRAREQAAAQFAARGGAAKSMPTTMLQVKLESENYTPAVDTESDQLSGTMTVSASIVGWDNQGLNSLVQKMLLDSYGPRYDLPMNQLRLLPPEVLNAQNGRLRVRVKADAMVIYTVDTDPVVAGLRGKTADEARAFLGGQPGLGGAPLIEINPAWAPRAYRIELAVAAPK